MEGNEVIDAGTLSSDKPISIFSNDIINKVTELNSKINTFKRNNEGKIDNGFDLSLKDIESEINKISYKVNTEIKPSDTTYSKALEDLYLLEYSKSTLETLISSFSVIKTLGE